MAQFYLRLAGPGACESDSLACNQASMRLYSLIDAWLQASGWTTLEWSNRIPSQTTHPDLWHDDVHPTACLVEDLVVGWVRKILRQQPNTASVLLIGDSTTAYCFDRVCEISKGDLAHRIKCRTGVTTWFESISGTKFTRWGNFEFQLSQGTYGGYTSDAVSLVGGWNQCGDPAGFTDNVFASFHQKALRALTPHRA